MLDEGTKRRLITENLLTIMGVIAIIILPLINFSLELFSPPLFFLLGYPFLYIILDSSVGRAMDC